MSIKQKSFNLCYVLFFVLFASIFLFGLNTMAGYKVLAQTDKGGGCYVAGGTYSVGGSIKNKSATNGGGIYAASGAKITMSSGQITNNTATNGGGVYLASGSSMVMSGGTISGNTATKGDAIYIESGASFTYGGGTISGNISLTRGNYITLSAAPSSTLNLVYEEALQGGDKIALLKGISTVDLKKLNVNLGDNMSLTISGGYVVVESIARVELGYYVGISGGGSGGGDVDPRGYVDSYEGVSYKISGNTITIDGTTYTATAYTGFAFDYWTIRDYNGDDIKQSDGSSGTLKNIKYNHIIYIYCHFKIIDPVDVTLKIEPTGESSSETVPKGSTFRLYDADKNGQINNGDGIEIFSRDGHSLRILWINYDTVFYKFSGISQSSGTINSSLTITVQLVEEDNSALVICVEEDYLLTLRDLSIIMTIHDARVYNDFSEEYMINTYYKYKNYKNFNGEHQFSNPLDYMNYLYSLGWDEYGGFPHFDYADAFGWPDYVYFTAEKDEAAYQIYRSPNNTVYKDGSFDMFFGNHLKSFGESWIYDEYIAETIDDLVVTNEDYKYLLPYSMPTALSQQRSSMGFLQYLTEYLGYSEDMMWKFSPDGNFKRVSLGRMNDWWVAGRITDIEELYEFEILNGFNYRYVLEKAGYLSFYPFPYSTELPSEAQNYPYGLDFETFSNMFYGLKGGEFGGEQYYLQDKAEELYNDPLSIPDQYYWGIPELYGYDYNLYNEREHWLVLAPIRRFTNSKWGDYDPYSDERMIGNKIYSFLYFLIQGEVIGGNSISDILYFLTPYSNEDIYQKLMQFGCIEDNFMLNNSLYDLCGEFLYYITYQYDYPHIGNDFYVYDFDVYGNGSEEVHEHNPLNEWFNEGVYSQDYDYYQAINLYCDTKKYFTLPIYKGRNED